MLGAHSRLKSTSTVLVGLLFSVVSVTAQPKQVVERLNLDQRTSGAVPTVATAQPSVRYQVFFPQDVFEVRIEIQNAPADLDILVYNNQQELVAFSELNVFDETLRLSRIGSPTLLTGPHTVEIAYQYPDPPVIGGVTLTEIPFELELRGIRPTVERVLSPGQSARGRLVPVDAMLTTYQIEVPPGTGTLRIDISETDGDLDLFVNRGRPVANPFDSDYIAQSVRSSEQLVITRESDPPLRPGTYYALVMDQFSEAYATDFTITIHDEPNAPVLLRRPIEPLPEPTTQLENAILATVEILADRSAGSGVIVSRTGLILTNWHVIQSESGGAADQLIVAFSRDITRPPEELFQAEVVEASPERDIALLQITSGRYGQALPPGYTFPFLALAEGDGPTIGTTLGFLGYPGIGGTGSRASITYTRGIVAGFYRVGFGNLIKTDGDINAGNSGGAAIDSSFRLVGLPTEVVGRDAGQIAYVYPVSIIPRSWRTRIQQ